MLMAIVWAAMILTSIMVTFFTESLVHADSAFIQVLASIPVFLFGAACVAMAVGMTFIIVIRFYKSLMGDEGYLMHTLPVKEWELITSKGMSATLYTIGCAIVVLISLAIFTKGAAVVELAKGFPYFLEHPVYILYVVQALVILIFGIVKSVYQVYASLAIGQLVDKHRILLATGAYCGISTAIGMLASIFAVIGININLNIDLFDPLTNLPNFAMMEVLLFVLFLIEFAQVAVFHVITERLLTKKLNLL